MWFIDVDDEAVKGEITGVGGATAIKAVGTVQFKTKNCENPTGPPSVWTEHKVVYVPSLPVNLMSPSRCRKRGLEWDYRTGNIINTRNKHQSVAKTEIRGGVFCFVTTGGSPGTAHQPTVPQALACAQLNARPPTIQLMHERLDHAGKGRLLKACKKAEINISQEEADSFHCESCALGKTVELVSRITPVKHSLPG